MSIYFTNGEAYNPDLFGSPNRGLAYVVFMLSGSTKSHIDFSTVSSADGLCITISDENNNRYSSNVDCNIAIYYVPIAESTKALGTRMI